MDVFPGIEPQMNALAGNGRLRAPVRVRDEIEQVGSEGLRGWAQNNNGIFVPHDEVLQTEANAIQAAHPELLDADAQHDEADRYVIALARLQGRTVVTYETPAAKKVRARGRKFIPDVCDALGVECIDLLEVMRREQWTF